jgi:signal transduction histidine kinase/ketosteroid isomerase-like protein
MTTLRTLVERYLRTFNARDFDAWVELFHDDVEIRSDAGPLHGRAAVRAFVEETTRAFPGVQAELDRIVAETAERIVVEYRLVDAERHESGWRLEGTVCDIYEMRDERIASCHSYYLSKDTDQTDVVPVPSRTEAVRMAEEQAALRRVATLVAEGVSRDELFAAVNEAVAQLVGADLTALIRFEADDMVTLVAHWSAEEVDVPVGARRPMDGPLRAVRASKGPLRFGPEDLPAYDSFAAEAQRLGVRSVVGVPIEVDGCVWGASFAVSTGDEPFPDDTDARVAAFTELIATAIGNAQARSDLHSLVAEQAALRRVATLVARGASQREIFEAVTTEASRLLNGQPTALLRFDADACATTVAVHGGPARPGARAPDDPDCLAAAVLRTAQPVRIDDYTQLGTRGAERARAAGVRAVVASPIIVARAVWGFFAAMSVDGPLPPGTEDRLSQFAELVATALANAQARSELRSLVEEQAALRRVATLVARGASQPEIFDAVTEQASRLLGGQPMALLRYDPGGDAFAVAVHGGPVAPGLRVPGSGDGLAARVRRTRRPVRIDSYDDVSGPAALVAHRIGLRAAVGAPVVVAGELWGLIEAMSTDDPLPPGTEHRVAQFAELVATAIANAESRAELTASRARVVTTADESRRRIQRDLHDGAQQRLVHTVITLKLLKTIVGGGANAALVDEALHSAEQATAELRELVQGIAPAALVRGGLRAGIASHLDQVDLPVHADITSNRFPPRVEMTAYFVVAEALTNVVKHAGATCAHVRVVDDDGALLVEVRDDGAGGADATRGTGLVGLTDRVAASGGSIAIASPPGRGTALTVTLPIGDEPAPGPQLGDPGRQLSTA